MNVSDETDRQNQQYLALRNILLRRERERKRELKKRKRSGNPAIRNNVRS